MAEEILQETWITLPAAFLPALGVLLIVAGICLLVWSDILVNLVIVFFGVLAVILGIVFLAAGHFMGRAGILPVFLLIAGLSSIMIGILTFLWRDLVFDLIIYLGATIAILAGLFFLFIGGLSSLHGWGRRVLLGGGAVFLLIGIALVLFPVLVTRVLLTAGGAVIAGAGCVAIFFAFVRR